MPPPNPKPFDQAFKTLVDADARGFLDAVGVLPADADADVEALPQEVAVSAVAMDASFVIRQRSGGDARVVVFEAMSRFGRESLERVVWYNTGLARKYRLPIDTSALGNPCGRADGKGQSRVRRLDRAVPLERRATARGTAASQGCAGIGRAISHSGRPAVSWERSGILARICGDDE